MNNKFKNKKRRRKLEAIIAMEEWKSEWRNRINSTEKIKFDGKPAGGMAQTGLYIGELINKRDKKEKTLLV